jgi:hypothetical protein
MDGLCLEVSLQSTSQSEIEKQVLQSLLVDMSARLDHWEDTLTTSPFSYRRDYNHSHETSHEHEDDQNQDHRRISFPNVTMANIFTHLWAFQIIIFREMATLSTALSETVSSPEHRAIALARNISFSMDYLLKEDMGLFGPASSSFPLRTAWEVLKESGDHVDSAHVKRSVDRLVARGLLSAPTSVFGPDCTKSVQDDVDVSR